VSARSSIALKEVRTGLIIPATLIHPVDMEYARRADDEWAVFLATKMAEALASGTPLERPEDGHWNWERKVRLTGHLLSYPFYAVECGGGRAQGLMLLKTDGAFGRLREQVSQALVSVEFLATAPWNREKIVTQPLYRGVGTVLVRAAVETSLALEFKGRIALHALPGAEEFYERIGMTCLGPDCRKKNLKYFEMTAGQAAAFMN
jgi:hypothetical protein